MPIELPRDERAQAIASIERYFNEELDIECHEDPFQYWRRRQLGGQGKR
jgi:predicted LPLAT superfamily acyltransferase